MGKASGETIGNDTQEIPFDKTKDIWHPKTEALTVPTKVLQTYESPTPTTPCLLDGFIQPLRSATSRSRRTPETWKVLSWAKEAVTLPCQQQQTTTKDRGLPPNKISDGKKSHGIEKENE